MEAIGLAADGARPQAATGTVKIRQAAQDFEALLLGSLLRTLEQTFSACPGDPHPAGSNDYAYLGTQALASGIAASGGLGIADLIVRNLMKYNGIEASGDSLSRTKVSLR
jgi:Rod binding domain-containing protein